MLIIFPQNSKLVYNFEPLSLINIYKAQEQFTLPFFHPVVELVFISDTLCVRRYKMYDLLHEG